MERRNNLEKQPLGCHGSCMVSRWRSYCLCPIGILIQSSNVILNMVNTLRASLFLEKDCHAEDRERSVAGRGNPVIFLDHHAAIAVCDGDRVDVNVSLIKHINQKLVYWVINGIRHLLGVGIISGGLWNEAFSVPSTLLLNVEQQDFNLAKAVEDALEASQKDSPQVHKDALAIWKNFSAKSPPPHYTYRFWARNLVAWLKKNKGISFDSQSKVAQVFGILRERGLISDEAAVTLSVDVWSYLIYLEGVPDWKNKSTDQDKKIMEEQA